MKIQKKQKTWIEESIEKMGEKPEDFACEGEDCEKARAKAEKEMNKRLAPAQKVAEKTKEEDHAEEGKPLKEEKENITSYDVKDRKELASLLEELHLTAKDVSIKRSVKEGCRYQVTLKSVLNETKEVKAKAAFVDDPTKDMTKGDYIDWLINSKGWEEEAAKNYAKLFFKEDLDYDEKVCKDILRKLREGANADIKDNIKKIFDEYGFTLESMKVEPTTIKVYWHLDNHTGLNTIYLGKDIFDTSLITFAEDLAHALKKVKGLKESKFSYVTDPNGLEGEVEANNKEEATKKVETELAQKGVAVSDEIIDVEEKKINESKSNYELEKEISKIRTYKELCKYVDAHPGLFLNSTGRFNLTVKKENEDGIEEFICDVSKFYRPFQKEVNKADLRVVKEEKEIDDGPEHGYESVEDYERAQAILDEMAALRKEEEEKGKAILKAWAIDKTMSDEEFHKQSEELHNSTQEKVEKLYKELIALPVKKESFEQDKEKAVNDAKAEAERLKYASLEDREKGKIFVVGDHVKYVNNDGWTTGGEENIGRTGTIVSSGRIGNLEIFNVFADDERYYKGYENFTFNATADNLEFTKEVNELKESIDKKALEFYVNNWEEGDNITVTADLLNVLEQALEMSNKYSKEECLHEDIDDNHPLVGKKVTWKEEEVTITGVEDEEGSVLFKLSNGKMIDPTIALGKTLKSEDEEVLAFIDAHKEKEPEEVKKDDEPKISEYDRGCEKAREDFKNRDKARYKKLKKNWDVEAHDDFDRGYMDTYSKLEKSAIANKQRNLRDITINNTYKGDVDELIDWLKNGGISSINVISNEDDFDRTKDFIDELNKRDGTSYTLKTTNKQGDSYEITLTTKKDILEKMPEEVKTWVALKNSGKFGSTAEKVEANVFNEKDHTLTSNGIVIDLLTNYGFHLGDYKEKKNESLEESQKGFVTFLNLELGVLVDKSDEFDYYSSAYDHKHGYYDETYLNGLEKDFDALKEDALNYLKDGVANTYAIITSIDVKGSEEDFEDVIQQMEEDRFIDNSVDFLDGEQFELDNVVWSAYKDENGKIHEGFLGNNPVEECKVENKVEEAYGENGDYKVKVYNIQWHTPEDIDGEYELGIDEDDPQYREKIDAWKKQHIENLPKELELTIKPSDEVEDENDLEYAIDELISQKYEYPSDFKFEILERPTLDIPDGFVKFEGYPTEVGEVGRELITKDGEHIWVTDYTEDDGGFWASRSKSDIQTGRGRYWPRDKIKFVSEEIFESLKESTQKEELDEGAYPLSKKVEDNVRNWWEDVVVWNQEHGNIFNIVNDDNYEDIEGWHAAMFDMLDDIKKQLEKEDDEELKALFKKGKRIYNNNALSQYREQFEKSKEQLIERKLDGSEGEYERTKHQIESQKEYVKELEAKLKTLPQPSDDEWFNSDMDDLYDKYPEYFQVEYDIDSTKQWIGELEGYLAELRYIDNGNSSDYSGFESLEEDIDDDFLTGDTDLVDAEEVDDDFGVAGMSYEEKMDFLAGDEQEAIDGYDEVIDTIEDEHVKDQLEHIKEEEIAHKEFLDAVKEDPTITYEEHDEQVIDNTPEEEFVDPEDVDDDMQVVIIDEK